MAATYGYYPEGGRAWKQVNGVTTLYLELDGVEWGSYDAAGTLKERTIRASGAGGAVVAVHSQAGGLIRLLPNRQGSVIGWLRPDGTLGGAYTYDAYGNSAQAGAAGPSFRYAGMRFDAETGLYHTPNRAYDPQDGRWMQLDPIGIKDGLNRYAYVKNSPLMGVDPTGFTCTSVNGIYKCVVDKILDKNGNKVEREDLKKDENKALKNLIVKFEKSYSAAVNKLASNLDKKQTLSMTDANGKNRSATVSSMAVAKALAGRNVVADSGSDKGGNTLHNVTTMGFLGLSGTGEIKGFSPTGTPDEQAEQKRQVSIVHEGMHGDGTYADEYMAPGGNEQMGRDPYNSIHQIPYNEAARDFLGY